MPQQPKQPRERKKANKLILHDVSCSPDHQFIERLIEFGLETDIAILDAWTPCHRRIAVETAVRR